MQLREQVTIVGNTYRARIELSTLTVDETNALARFGDLSVDVGGDFESDTDTDVVFTLPTSTRFFPSQFPVQQLFSADDVDAAEKSDTWIMTVVDRILTERDLAVAKDATAIRDEIVDYPVGA
jgi:hypothetical protein